VKDELEEVIGPLPELPTEEEMAKEHPMLTESEAKELEDLFNEIINRREV
jgi:hypothetical protein